MSAMCVPTRCLKLNERLAYAPGRASVACEAQHPYSAALLVVLAFATLVNLGLLASMGPDVVHVFDRALARSSLLATVPLTALWFLERRERATPWLFAAAFLRGGCIATGLALPFNTAFFMLADLWVARHPSITQVLGPDAAMMLAAPLSAPIAEEITKALGLLVLVWMLR